MEGRSYSIDMGKLKKKDTKHSKEILRTVTSEENKYCALTPEFDEENY